MDTSRLIDAAPDATAVLSKQSVPTAVQRAKGLKVRNMPAQGRAQGQSPAAPPWVIGEKTKTALKGRHRHQVGRSLLRRNRVSLLQSSDSNWGYSSQGSAKGLCPSALPWADMFRPFRPFRPLRHENVGAILPQPILPRLRCGLVFTALLLLSQSLCADEFFTQKIEPLLKSRCFECHSHEKSIEGGLALDSKSGWQKGGAGGPAVVPGKPESSLLIQAIGHTEVDLKMPPDKRLPVEEIALLTEWVKRGAVDPRVLAPTASGKPGTPSTWEAEFKQRLTWWSLQPMGRAEPPQVTDTTWSSEPVDRFILAGLQGANLTPAPPADPLVLLRRLSFVLTGLPPTAADVHEFSQAHDDAAYERLVDRMLNNPHFGERFARHWMDVVRYTDTYGYEWDNPAKGSHEYRDYLIRAFNDDIGFDRLLREQLAGDLLPQARIHPIAGTHENLIAPMFYHLGEHRHGSSLMFNGIHQEMVNNKIDAFSKAFLATTVACARCHDHKLEAVSQHDYYALAAVLTTPRWTTRVADAPAKHDAAIAKLKELRQAIRGGLAKLWSGTTLTPQAVKDAVGDVTNAKPQIQEVLYPLVRLIQRDMDAHVAWLELQTEWKAASESRRTANASFQHLGDIREAKFPAGWVTEGDGMQHGLVGDATPLVALDGDAVITRLLPGGIHTHALSSKLPGALRMPPQHVVPDKFVSVNIAGGEFGGYLVMDDHAFQNETVTFLSNVEPIWRSFADPELKNGVQQVTVEFVTSSMNPNFPPRTGVAPGLPNTDFGYDKRSWISITGIVTHPTGATPQDSLETFATLFQRDAPASGDEAWQTVCDWMLGAVKRWCDGQVQPGDRVILDWMLSKKLLVNQAAADSPLAHLRSEYRSIEGTIAFPRTVNSMDERETTRANYPLNVRGNVDVLGVVARPDFLQMFSGRHGVATSPGSGRVELTDFLLDAEHPLTSRVYVNRVWQWIFGTGIVATPDDFGHMGDKPSHPELLDWLAREFVREGWSNKKLIRRLVLSQTFRQSGIVDGAARQHDPNNRLLHHYPTRRLEAEAIRDELLAVSGRLDPKLYGRPILPPRAAEDGSKRLYSGPIDGDGRRSIYLQMSIMAPPQFLVGFNLPDLKLPTGRRDVTNVPAQALVMLNDPFVNAMAKRWAGQLVQQNQANPADRIRDMFVIGFGREPAETEKQRWQFALRDFASGPETHVMKDELAWQRLAHAIFNSKEFLYYR